MNHPLQPADPALCSYVLITPARNEEKYIEGTIRSVIRQTLLPKRWVVVSDGSTDRTDEIVMKYLDLHPWIRLVRIDGHTERNFASKAGCFNSGYRSLGDLEYDVIGNLDADVSFENDFFESLIRKFANDRSLGVAGASFVDDSVRYNYGLVGVEHVSGLCQLFRRRCFEEIGGYRHIPGGGVDLVAVMTARMEGWKTRTFTEISCRHHRTIGTGVSGPVRARYRYGREDYYLGSHPVWEVLRCARHIGDRPYLLAALSLFAGYAVSWISRHPRPVSPDFIRFRRREQMRRLTGLFRNSPYLKAFRNKPSEISSS